MNARGYALVVGVCALLITAGATVALRGAQQDQPTKAELERQLQQLLQERVKTAERATDALNAAFDAQTTTLDQLVEAANKLANARLEVATTPAERIVVLEQHLQRMTVIEQKIETLYKIGTRGGEMKEYATSMRERQTAEIALLRARIKNLK